MPRRTGQRRYFLAPRLVERSVGERVRDFGRIKKQRLHSVATGCERWRYSCFKKRVRKKAGGMHRPIEKTAPQEDDQ